MTTPSPHRGVFRWAWHRAQDYLARFWIGAVVFSAVITVASAVIIPPEKATLGQRIFPATLALAAAIVLTVGGSYVCALVAAPFQQRNKLRRLLAAANTSIAALEATPVTSAHAGQLREIAGRLQSSLKEHRALDYGADAAVWRSAFYEHFPDVQVALETAGEADTAFVLFKERLERESQLKGMDRLPWTPDWYLPWLTTTIHARALQGILGADYKFDWDSRGDLYWYMGDAVYRHDEVFQVADPADAPRLKKEFEDFFHDAETWPEAAAIRRAWDRRDAAEEAAIERLAEIAYIDPITSSCKLCRRR